MSKVFDCTFSADLAAPAAARHALTGLLNGLDPPTIDDVLLVTGELVANAVVHGAGPVSLHAEVLVHDIRIEVHDDNPVVGPAGPQSRGLALVAALSRTSGTTSDHHGKTAWGARPAVRSIAVAAAAGGLRASRTPRRAGRRLTRRTVR